MRSVSLFVLFQILGFLGLVEASLLSDYAPVQGQCPSGSLLRTGQGKLAESESSWLSVRDSVTTANLKTFLSGAGLTDFDVDSFFSSATRTPRIALAFSGGGYRAMFQGAGQLSAFDSRTSTGGNGLKGLLQSSTYLAGLSGGSWLVGTIAMNNLISVEDLINNGELWNLESSMIDPYGLNVVADTAYYTEIAYETTSKWLAGFELTITDSYGRGLSNQCFSTFDNNGSGLTFSSLQSDNTFTSGQMPMPIVVSDGKAPGTYVVNSNSTVFEFTPFELGSWDPSLNQFTQTKYLGTNADGGISNGTCATGFDNAGYVIGTSASLFNQIFVQFDSSTYLPSWLKSLFDTFLFNHVDSVGAEVAAYKPNPFYDSNGQSLISKDNTLYLADGGEDNQNIPLYPLIQPQRGVDVIFANDNSADVNNWPNGDSLVQTYERQFTPQGNGVAFPHVPDTNTFLNLNLTARPTFFGCSAANMTDLSSNPTDIPLVVYLANRPFSYWTNTSTEKLSYSNTARAGMIQNGFDVNTRKDGALDNEWAACVGCAIIRREQERQGIAQSDQCKECFANYCWDGQYASQAVDTINFTDEGITPGAGDYNSNNTPGYNDGGLAILKEVSNSGIFVDDSVGGFEQWEFFFQVVVFQQFVDFLGGQDTLRRLAVQQHLFSFPSINVLFNHISGNLDVSTTGTGGDQISNTGGFFGECGWVWCGLGLDAKSFPVRCKVDDFLQSDSHDGGLGVVTPAGTFDETNSNGNDVLQGTSNGGTNNVFNDVDVEVWSVEGFLQDVFINVLTWTLEVIWNGVGNGGFGPSLSSDFVSNVGTRQDTTVDSQGVGDGLRQQFAAFGVDFQTLQTGDGSDVRADLSDQLLADSTQELVRDVENQQVCVLNRRDDVRVGNQVVWQGDIRQVLDVFVLGVDDLGQFLTFDLFFKHPHVNVLVEKVGLFSGVLCDQLGDSSTPVTGANDGNSKWRFDFVWNR